MAYTVQHFTTRNVLCPAVIFWGTICAATAGVTSWQGLFVQRFFLGLFTSKKFISIKLIIPGFTESIIPTAFMTMVSGYYTQREQALRQSWWFSGTGWFTIIGGGLNYGFAQVKSGSLAPWQYIYIFAGCITALFGIWTYFLPNSPADAWFLTPEERIAAVERLRAGQTGVKNTKFKAEQVKEALLDVKIWLVAITMAAA